MSGWFNSLGWWDQNKAYKSFNIYRNNPFPGNLVRAIKDALPIIRVVYSTQKVKAPMGDEDDLISSAALTITNAIPKMAKKPVEKLDDNKKYMRYLFTCVINAFLREYEVIHGKNNRVKRSLEDKNIPVPKSKIKQLEAKMVLSSLPNRLYDLSIANIRFSGEKAQVCEYIIHQLLYNREISKSILSLLNCSNSAFLVEYCKYIIFISFLYLRDNENAQEDSDGYDNIVDTMDLASEDDYLLDEAYYEV